MDTIVSALRSAAVDARDRTALVAGADLVTFSQLWNRSLTAAARFRDEGVRAGDRVLIAAPSKPAFAYAYFGAHALGATAVPIDVHLPQSRVFDIVRRAKPALIVGSLSGTETPGIGTLELDALDSKPVQRIDSMPDLTDSADLVFTTGTSGRPKGVCLTHRAIASAATHINEVIGLSERDTQVVPIPLNHSFGLGRLRCAILARATTVLVNGFRLPGEILVALEQHGATALAGVPAGFAVLLRLREKGLDRFAGSLRHVEIGSAPMPLEHKLELMRLLPTTELFMHYGLTEASRSAFIEFHSDRDNLDTVGRPAPRVRIEVRDDSGRPCGPGVDGMLWITGDHLASCYWDDDAATADTFVAGWVRTGDFGSIDARGCVHLRGRADDMINTGGYKVSPDEIEHELAQHAAISDAGCIGVTDERGIAGELICAFLVNERDSAPIDDRTLKSWLRDRLEPYKVPTRIVWVDALPRSGSGKLQRAELRRMVTAEAAEQVTGTR